MKGADSRSVILALHAWLDESESDRNAMLLAEHIIEKALSAHFGFFRFLIERVDGKLHLTAEEEMTFETGCVLVVPEGEREGGKAKAA